VLFANFAEAVAEGRGKAQADTLRKSRKETTANRIKPDGTIETVPSARLEIGGCCVVAASEVIPGDGDVVEGIAVVDESAITGESARVIREAGGDRSAVTDGTVVLSDRITVQVTSSPGETFLDKMIGLVEGASRQKTPNEIALDILVRIFIPLSILGALVLVSQGAVHSGSLAGARVHARTRATLDTAGLACDQPVLGQQEPRLPGDERHADRDRDGGQHDQGHPVGATLGDKRPGDADAGKERAGAERDQVGHAQAVQQVVHRYRRTDVEGEHRELPAGAG
jgi:hypothetical protein